jgi:hypothetical protein
MKLCPLLWNKKQKLKDSYGATKFMRCKNRVAVLVFALTSTDIYKEMRKGETKTENSAAYRKESVSRFDALLYLSLPRTVSVSCIPGAKDPGS